MQSAESPSVALSKVTRNHNESEARKKLPRQWSGQAQAPRKNAKLGQAKEERQDKYLHFRLGFRCSHGRDAGRRGSSPRVRAGIGVNILVFGVNATRATMLPQILLRHRFKVAGAVTIGLGSAAYYRRGRTVSSTTDVTSPAGLVGQVSRALDVQLLPEPGPAAADAALASMGLFGAIACIGVLEALTGLPLFAPPMMASGIIFFVGQSPPHPKGFFSGTLCSATLSLGALALLSPILTPVAAQGAAAGVLLAWYKSTGASFPPAAVLAGVLLTATTTSLKGAGASSLKHAQVTVRYLAFPWLAGHAILYGWACAVSELRSRVRVLVTQRNLLALKGHSDEVLKELFIRFDTSGDGALDADELKVALRSALGVDLSLSDCERLIGAADRDGNGVVDFEEFCAICRGML